jgi:hypothetical protein
MEAVIVVLLVVAIVLLLGVGSGGRRAGSPPAPTERPSPGRVDPPGQLPATSADRDGPRPAAPHAGTPPPAPPPGAPRATDADLEAHILRREDAAFVEGMVIGHYVWPARPRDDDRQQVDPSRDELAWALGDDEHASFPDGEDEDALDDLAPDVGFGMGYEGGYGGMADLDEEDADEAAWGNGFDDPWDDGFDDGD